MSKVARRKTLSHTDIEEFLSEMKTCGNVIPQPNSHGDDLKTAGPMDVWTSAPNDLTTLSDADCIRLYCKVMPTFHLKLEFDITTSRRLLGIY